MRVPVEHVMNRDERSRKYFENMMRSKYNHGRVVVDTGNIMVDEDYDVGDFHEIYDLYIQAEAVAKNTHALAMHLSKYLGEDQENSLYLYLRYGSFKHFERARIVKAALRRYIQEHSLFGVAL